MAMLPDLLKEIIADAHGRLKDGPDRLRLPPEVIGDGTTANNIMRPNQLMGQMNKDNIDKGNIYDDAGSIVGWNGSPLSSLKDMISKSRGGGDGVLRQLLSSLLQGKMVPGTGTVGGGGPPDHVPGTRQDAALNPTPMKEQPQPNFTPMPLPQPRLDYSQPSALDPASIEQLRHSLLSDAGQLDPNNPNGLSGRMNDPNSQADMNNQRKESQSIEDSVRGFDGSRKANIQKGNQ